MVNEKWNYNIERASRAGSNVGGNGRNETLLRSASRQSGGYPSSPAIDSRPHRRRITGSSHRRGHRWLRRQRWRRVALLTRNIRALSDRLLISINIAQKPG